MDGAHSGRWREGRREVGRGGARGDRQCMLVRVRAMGYAVLGATAPGMRMASGASASGRGCGGTVASLPVGTGRGYHGCAGGFGVGGLGVGGMGVRRPGGRVGVSLLGWRRQQTRAMALKTGIVGLPNVGKSTLFNALVENGKAEAANFPFCTIEPNVGIVPVPDPRLQTLSKISKSKKVINTTIEFVDIAGLVAGASEGEGLGNKFLSHIREVDAIVQVVRCFEDGNVVHVSGKVDPLDDIAVINLELALADLSQVEKRMDRLHKSRGKATPAEQVEFNALERIKASLSDAVAARSVELSDEEAAAVKHLCLLTMKPMLYATNVAEEDLGSAASPDSAHPLVSKVRAHAAKEGAGVVVVSAQTEAELQDLDDEERAEYLRDLGVVPGTCGLPAIIQGAYRLLGLLTYFTTGEQETRAWTIREGWTGPQAAGVIHSDFEKGYIRAETVAYADFEALGGEKGAREAGKLRAEGKEYRVKEGDVMHFLTSN